MGEYIASFKPWFTGGDKERKERLEKRSTLLLIVALSAELICLVRTNQISGEVIGALDTKAAEAYRKSGAAVTNAERAIGEAKTASDEADSAKTESGKAKDVAGKAEALARGARQEADSFEKDIASAMRQATEAEAHLKDALGRAEAAATLAKGYEKQIADAKRDASEAKSLLAVARQLAAEARQQAGEAVVGVSELKANRSLSNAAELSTRLKEFENTEYAFSGVFADEESLGLLKQIDEALRRAGWRRAKGTHRFPALEVFGKDDDVNEIVGTGVQISVESPELLATLQALPPAKLPLPLNAAIALNLGLSSGISPQDARAKLVNVQPGTSKIVQISVGKKP
jgi:hypothetical protein